MVPHTLVCGKYLHGKCNQYVRIASIVPHTTETAPRSLLICRIFCFFVLILHLLSRSGLNNRNCRPDDVLSEL